LPAAHCLLPIAYLLPACCRWLLHSSRVTDSGFASYLG
jgi:hypothetical protein